MYTLREVAETHENNEILGTNYQVVNRFCHKESFRHYFKSHFGIDHTVENLTETTEKIDNFIITDKSIPLYRDRSYYVMTESGKTFQAFVNKD